MNLGFTNVDFQGSYSIFYCQGALGGNCNVTLQNVDFVDVPSSYALLVEYAVGVSIDSASFTGCSQAMDMYSVESVSLTDSSVEYSTSTSAAMVFTSCSGVYIGNTQLSNNVYNPDFFVSTSTTSVTFDNVQASNNSGASSVGTLFAFVQSGVNWNNVGVDGNNGQQIIQLYDTTAVWNDVTVENNIASLYTISVDSSSQLTMTNTQVNSNAAQYGGAITVLDANVVASYCTFNGNKASSLGGALYSVSSSVSWSDITISNNDAQTGGAGYCTGTAFSDPNCNYQDNNSYDGSAPLQC